jgi:hypothetical protein
MEESNEKIVMPVNTSDNFAEPSGNTYKGRRELLTDYWCEMKKQARAEGRDYTEDDKQADIEVAKLKYPFEGRYVIDALGNVQPLKKI